MTDTNAIGFAGLSHLGIIYSSATIARSFPVVAYDSREGLSEALSQGTLPVNEPGLEELIRAHRERIRYTADVDELARCRLIFFALDVQTDASNNSDLGPLEALIESVASRAADGTVLVAMSQVPSGFCRKLQTRLGPRLALFYQVETLVFGNAVERAVHPERYMVGCACPDQAVPE